MTKPRSDDAPRILVVDDDEHIVSFVTKMLEAQGYLVIPAVGAEQAIGVLDDSELRIDLLLSDVVMPGMSGTELAECVRERMPGLPIILMTGYSGVLEEHHSVLRKPFGWSDLEATVANALKVPN